MIAASDGARRSRQPSSDPVLEAPQQESDGSRAGGGTRRREQARSGRVRAARSILQAWIMWGQMSYADLTGLPPMLIQAGSAETLDNATRFATAGGAADVFVTLVLNRDGVRGPSGDMVVFDHQSASELGSTQAALRPIHQ